MCEAHDDVAHLHRENRRVSRAEMSQHLASISLSKLRSTALDTSALSRAFSSHSLVQWRTQEFSKRGAKAPPPYVPAVCLSYPSRPMQGGRNHEINGRVGNKFVTLMRRGGIDEIKRVGNKPLHCPLVKVPVFLFSLHFRQQHLKEKSNDESP